jgi:ABC-2 type transport system permease protein
VIALLVRHEWRVLSRSAVVRLVTIVFGVALLAASLFGAARASRDARVYDAFSARATAASRTPARADAVANERGYLAMVPVPALAALAAGQSDVYPQYLKVTARNAEALVTGDQIDHPRAVAAGHFDVAFVVLFLYPLLVFAISFDLTASERDGGLLRMLLAQPVRLRDVVTARMLSRWLLLAVPVVVIPAVTLAATSPAAIGATVIQLVLWSAAVIAYGLIWHGIALIVNARGGNAAANALVLAGIWLIFTVVGPATINLLIAITYPMPSRVEAAVQARAATQEATVQGSRALGQFLEDHPTSANVGQEGMRQFARLQAERDRQIADRLQGLEANFNQQRARQQQLASWLSVLSPTMVAQGVLLEIAGTSASRFERFASAVRDFQKQWQAYFEPRVLDAATVTPAEIASAPTFQFIDDDAARTTTRTTVPIAAMAIVGAALSAVGMWMYRRYSV